MEEQQVDLFTEDLSIDDCDLSTKDGRKRGLEIIAKWAMSKPMERIKAIETICKMDGDFVVKAEVNQDGEKQPKTITILKAEDIVID